MSRLLFFAAAFAVGLAGPATADELYGTLKKIKDSGQIVLGHRESSYPFSFLDASGRPVGYSIDLCVEIVAAVKKELGLAKLETVFKAVDPQTRIPQLVDGTIDIECGSTTNTLTRQEQVDFTHITYVTGAKLLAKAESDIADFGDLDGKTIALAKGTTTEAGVMAVLGRTPIQAAVLEVADHAEGFQALKDGQADVYVSDHILLYGLAQKAETPQDYKVVGNFLSYEPYALMVRRDDSAFRLVANRTLSGIFRSDGIGQIYARWFEPMGAPPGDLMTAAVRLQSLPE